MTLSIANSCFNQQSTLAPLAIKPGHKVLTVGCGSGLLAHEIAKCVGPTGTVLVTDVSEHQLDIAEKYTQQNKRISQVTNLTFQQLDCSRIDTIEGTFDRILCRLALSRLDNSTACSSVLQMVNKLKPFGKLVLEESHPLCEQAKLVCNTAPTLMDFLEANGYKVTYTIPSAYFLHDTCSNKTIAQICLTKYY